MQGPENHQVFYRLVLKTLRNAPCHENTPCTIEDEINRLDRKDTSKSFPLVDVFQRILTSPSQKNKHLEVTVLPLFFSPCGTLAAENLHLKQSPLRRLLLSRFQGHSISRAFRHRFWRSTFWSIPRFPGPGRPRSWNRRRRRQFCRSSATCRIARIETARDAYLLTI